MSDGYIGVVPVPQASRVLSFTTLTAASTTYVVPPGYKPGMIRVCVNGLFVTPDEYTATDGIQIVFPQTLPVGTVVSVEELTAFEVSTSYTQAQSDLRFSQLSGGAAANFAAMPQVGGAPVIESGSNANGSYTKWADGTMICTSVPTLVTDGATAVTSSGGTAGTIGITLVPLLTYPSVFSGIPTTKYVTTTIDGGGANMGVAEYAAGSASATGSAYLVGQSRANAFKVSCIAVGRWE